MSSSFLPAKRNFPWWRGSTFRYAFEWKDEELVEDEPVSKPHDLTNYTALCVLAPVPGESGEPIKLTNVSYSSHTSGIIFGGVHEEPTNGLIEIYIRQEAFEAITWKKANYTLYAMEPEGPEDDYALLTGRFTLAGPPL